MSNSHSRPNWDEYVVAGAEWAATRADCRRRKHGAMILDEFHRVAAVGYNGAASGGGSCLAGDCPRGLRSYEELATMSGYDTGEGRCLAIHAELNALLIADASRIRGGTIGVTGEPCPGCRRHIGGSGLKRLVYRGLSGALIVEEVVPFA